MGLGSGGMVERHSVKRIKFLTKCLFEIHALRKRPQAWDKFVGLPTCSCPAIQSRKMWSVCIFHITSLRAFYSGLRSQRSAFQGSTKSSRKQPRALQKPRTGNGVKEMGTG